MSNETPAGAAWYPDPWQQGQLRYWDGKTWTGHTAPAGATPVQPSQAPSPTSTPAKRPWWQRKSALIGGAVAVLLVIGALMGEEPSDKDDEVPAAQSSTPTPTPTPEPEPVEEEPTAAEVPALRGLDVSAAKRALRDVGLRVGEIQRLPSAKEVGTVLKQIVPSGAEALLGSAVALVVAAPLPKVPSVVGASGSEAASILKAAGFRVTTSTETRTSGTSGVVLSQSPSGGVSVQPGKEVHLVIAKVVVPLVSSGGSGGGNCTPGYDPCLAPASDYDCEGGSGNGPAYTGFVKVTGSDPYDLDSDGDGLACED